MYKRSPRNDFQYTQNSLAAEAAPPADSAGGAHGAPQAHSSLGRGITPPYSHLPRRLRRLELGALGASLASKLQSRIPPPLERLVTGLPCLLWPNGWMDQDATWYDGRPRPGQHCVRCGPSSTLKEHSPQISAHVCQTAGCIKMPLGRKVGLGPGRIVLHGDPASRSQKGHSPLPNFRPMSCGQTVAHFSYC